MEAVGHFLSEIATKAGGYIFVQPLVGTLVFLETNLLVIDGKSRPATLPPQQVGANTPKNKDNGNYNNNSLDYRRLGVMTERLQHGGEKMEYFRMNEYKSLRGKRGDGLPSSLAHGKRKG